MLESVKKASEKSEEHKEMSINLGNIEKYRELLKFCKMVDLSKHEKCHKNTTFEKSQKLSRL